MKSNTISAAVAAYDAACAAEDANPEAGDEARWHAGRDILRAKVETAEDAVLLLRAIDADIDGPPAGTVAAMIETIQGGLVSADLPLLRQQVECIRATAAAGWSALVGTSMAGLSVFLFTPKLTATTTRAN